MKRLLLIVLPLLLCISVLNSQTGQIKVGRDEKIEIIDQKLLPENWLLADTNNIKELDRETYNIFKSELNKMVNDFNKELEFESFFQVKEIKTYNKALPMSNAQKDAYVSALLTINNPTEAEAEWLKAQYTNVETISEVIINNRIIPINKKLITKQPKWPDIIKYLGGYSELAKFGISKDDTLRFKIEIELESIELTSQNSCMAKIKIKGDKKYGLKFYNIPKTEYKYKGTYNFDEIDYPKIYALASSKNDVINPIPNINFIFGEKDYMEQQEIVIPLNKVDKDYFVSVASPYGLAMRQMINDLVSYESYIEMDHIQKLVRNFDKECENNFLSFKKHCIDVIEKDINYFLMVNKNRKLNKLIKKFKKNNPNPVIRHEQVRLIELEKTSRGEGHDYKSMLNGTNTEIVPIYSRELLEFLAENSGNDMILSSLQTIDYIKNSTNFFDLLLVLCVKEPLEYDQGGNLRMYYNEARRIQFLIHNLPFYGMQEWFVNSNLGYTNRNVIDATLKLGRGLPEENSVYFGGKIGRLDIYPLFKFHLDSYQKFISCNKNFNLKLNKFIDIGNVGRRYPEPFISFYGRKRKDGLLQNSGTLNSIKLLNKYNKMYSEGRIDLVELFEKHDSMVQGGLLTKEDGRELFDEYNKMYSESLISRERWAERADVLLKAEILEVDEFFTALREQNKILNMKKSLQK